MERGARRRRAERPFADAFRRRGGSQRPRAAPRTPGPRRGQAPLPPSLRAALQSAPPQSPATFQNPPKHFASPEGAHLGRSRGDGQYAPDLVKFHPFDMTQHNRLPVLHGKQGERPVKPCLTLAPFQAIHDRFLIVGHLGHVWPVLVAGSAPGRATLFPQDVLASVQRDTTHPSGEPRPPPKNPEGEGGLYAKPLRDSPRLPRL